MATKSIERERKYNEAAEIFSKWLCSAKERPGSEEYQRRYRELSFNVIQAYQDLRRTATGTLSLQGQAQQKG